MRSPWAALALLAAGCSARAGGSLPHAAPLATDAVGSEESTPAVVRPSGSRPTPDSLRRLCGDPFFRGLDHLAARLPVLVHTVDAVPAGLRPTTGAPLVVESRGLAREAARRMAQAGRRAPRILLAMGFSTRATKPPRACADVLLDPKVLGRSLDADRSTSAPIPGAEGASLFSLELLERGKGPFTFDFRWSFRADRKELPSGAVLVRYELVPVPAPERVSVFEGVVVLEPDGEGTRLAEVLVLGSDLSLPFFLTGQAGKGVEKILRIRAERLAALLR